MLLRLQFREKLLDCITQQNLINRMSYIERLKQNTIPVMKFRNYPETYEKLQHILGEEAKYYKINKTDLLKDFNKSFINPTPEIELDILPSTFTPVRAVKIKDKYYKTELPEYFHRFKQLDLDFETDPLKQDYLIQLKDEYAKIEPSKDGYSFLLKIKEFPNTKTNKITKYIEKGSVVSLSLKPEYFKSTGPVQSWNYR